MKCKSRCIGTDWLKKVQGHIVWSQDIRHDMMTHCICDYVVPCTYIVLVLLKQNNNYTIKKGIAELDK